MNFKDIIDMTLNRVQEDTEDTDEQVLEVVKNGINEGYMLTSVITDPITKGITLEYKKPIILPSDLFQIINIEHDSVGDLSFLDYIKKANLLYIKSRDVQGGKFVLTYIRFPDKLINLTDELVIKDTYCYAVSVYAAYAYQLYRKKIEIAKLLLNEFKQIVDMGGVNNDTETNIQARTE